MLFHRVSHSRGFADHGWLKSHHSFSFADYYDPQFMGFSALRVINEDFIAPGAGFPTHGHKDMEIITYMIEGILEHKDTLGNSERLHAGEVQRMTAGTGVRHSEFNHSANSPIHLLQIWIEPQQKNLPPSYEQRSFAQELLKAKHLTLLVSPNQNANSLKIHQDIKIYGYQSKKKTHLSQDLTPQRKYYMQIIKGQPHVNGIQLAAGDALALQNEIKLEIMAEDECEFLFFDLP